MRTFDAPERSMATSRMAASGGTRVARTAGMTAAIERDDDADRASARTVVATVMVTPDAKSSPIARDEALGEQDADARGRGSAPTRPTTTPSTITADSTCRRLAPTARSRASSRVRCCTMIENVL